MASLALFTLPDPATTAGIDRALWDAVTTPLRVDSAAVGGLLRAGGVAHQGTIPLVDVEALDEGRPGGGDHRPPDAGRADPALRRDRQRSDHDRADPGSPVAAVQRRDDRSRVRGKGETDRPPGDGLRDLRHAGPGPVRSGAQRAVGSMTVDEAKRARALESIVMTTTMLNEFLVGVLTEAGRTNADPTAAAWLRGRRHRRNPSIRAAARQASYR